MIAELYKKFKDGGGTNAQIARDTGLHSTIVSKALSGWENYTLSEEKKREAEEKITNYLNNKVGEAPTKSGYEELITNAGYLAFENTENIIASVIKASKQASLMKITAPSGTGKTTAIGIVKKKLPEAVMITAYYGMTHKELLEDEAAAIKIAAPAKTAKGLMRDIKKELQAAKKLLIFDEANFLSEKSLEQLRHIHDLCAVGVILVGTEALEATIKRSHPQVATRIRTGLEVRAFGVAEVRALCEKYGMFETKAEEIYKAKKNLRDAEYFLQDAKEYGVDEAGFKEALKRF